jgi:hypothetical protein
MIGSTTQLPRRSVEPVVAVHKRDSAFVPMTDRHDTVEPGPHRGTEVSPAGDETGCPCSPVAKAEYPMENIVVIVVIVLIVLFVLGYFGRGRLRR